MDKYQVVVVDDLSVEGKIYDGTDLEDLAHDIAFDFELEDEVKSKRSTMAKFEFLASKDGIDAKIYFFENNKLFMFFGRD